jgi:hypothetical protein
VNDVGLYMSTQTCTEIGSSDTCRLEYVQKSGIPEHVDTARLIVIESLPQLNVLSRKSLCVTVSELAKI